MTKSWRTHARAIIAEVIRQHAGEDLETVRKAISAEYPYGERKYWPYKVWLDETHKQLRDRARKPDTRQMEILT